MTMLYRSYSCWEEFIVKLGKFRTIGWKLLLANSKNLTADQVTFVDAFVGIPVDGVTGRPAG
jgi:hypothetical protein